MPLKDYTRPVDPPGIQLVRFRLFVNQQTQDLMKDLAGPEDYEQSVRELFGENADWIIAMHTRANEIDNTFHSRIELASAFEATGNQARAIEQYEHNINAKDPEPAAYRRLVALSLQNGNLAEAVTICERYLELLGQIEGIYPQYLDVEGLRDEFTVRMAELK